MRNLTISVLSQLREALPRLPQDARAAAEEITARQDRILKRFHGLIGKKLAAVRVRCHGDYHLGQVLFTGKDFVIIDFEGEPARSVTERRLKRSPLIDVAGMIRSFDYAAHAMLLGPRARSTLRTEDMPQLEKWVRFWERWVSSAFLRAYLGRSKKSGLVPQVPEQLQLLLTVFLLEKGIYEIGYELNNRPDWLRLPCEGVLALLSE